MIDPVEAEPSGTPPTRRSSPFDDPAFVAGLRPIPSGPLTGAERRPAVDIVGVDLEARPVEIRIRTFDLPVLLCFLHVHCDGCEGFWRGLRDTGPADYPETVSAVVVTKGPGAVDRAEVARAAHGLGSVPVVMSDAAWADYRVTGYPFFVLVDAGNQRIVGETVGFGWSDVRAMIEVAGS